MLLIWLSAVLTLSAGVLLTYLLRPHKEGTVPFRVRLHRNKRVLRLMRRILRTRDIPAYTSNLEQASFFLTVHLRRMNSAIAALPPLPTGSDGEPRLMEAAREAADEPTVSAEALLTALQGHAFTPDEIVSFPACVAFAESQRLSSVLSSMLTDVMQAQLAHRLLRRMQRSKLPAQLLQNASVNSFGLHYLYQTLQDGQQDSLLALVKARLEELELSPDALSSSAEQRSRLLSDELLRAEDIFSALEAIDWAELCCDADATHSLLLGDPGNVYPRMDVPSQLQLRLEIGQFSRHAAMPATEVIRRAFILCGSAEEGSPENCVSYYFQTAQGMTALHQSLPSKRGWLHSSLARRPEILRYGLLWCLSFLSGFGFLQSGQPVFMLPFFAVLVGGVLRQRGWTPIRRFPQMALIAGNKELRTLVILPVMMADTADVLRAVQHLQSLIRHFGDDKADYLLLGDFPPAITAVSGGDLPLLQAASTAVAGLADSRVMYLHRGRTWNDVAHRYCARGGSRGAITELCRLISTGECRDTIAYATIAPASLERRYAYVLCIDENTRPAPGLLTSFLSVMAHPLCQPYPSQKGMRGHAMLLPEEDEYFSGTAFLRPDAFLEAVDGKLHDHLAADPLCGELAGQTRVAGAHILRSVPPDTWDVQYHQTIRAWRLIPWQLPIVSTPMGWVDNHLSFFQRFHLREVLRKTLAPLSQTALMLWGLLTGNWPMMLLSVLLPELGVPLRRREDFVAVLCRISLLPTRTAVDIAAVFRLLRRRASATPEWVPFETWVQGISAALMAALVFILPAAASAAFALAVLFACFPLAHRLLDK
nr:hypothetical protein [Clostridia bacterium]